MNFNKDYQMNDTDYFELISVYYSTKLCNNCLISNKN